MNSRVSWSVESIDPSVRERAEAAARRAGMSLNDWLNSTIGESAPPLTPGSLDFAIAEIAARQNELDVAAPAPRSIPPRAAPAMPPAMAPATPPGPDFSSLERHLFKITSQIEALQRPSGIEQSIA